MLAVNVYPGATQAIPRMAPENVPTVPAASPLGRNPTHPAAGPTLTGVVGADRVGRPFPLGPGVDMAAGNDEHSNPTALRAKHSLMISSSRRRPQRHKSLLLSR